jgi:hypothetical protein
MYQFPHNSSKSRGLSDPADEVGLEKSGDVPGWRATSDSARIMTSWTRQKRNRSERSAPGVFDRKEGGAVTALVYEDHGVHFEYPSSWSLEVTDEGPVTTVDLQHPGGIAFVLVRTDEERPDPADLADQALEAMREEYPELDAFPAMETFNEHHVMGHDVEFFSLDIANAAIIRSFRTARRTVLVFGQWSDLGEDDLGEVVRDVFRSLEELDE